MSLSLGLPGHCTRCAMHALAIGVQALQDIADVSGQLGCQALLAVPGDVHRILPGMQVYKGLHTSGTHAFRVRTAAGSISRASEQHAPQTANPHKAYKSGCMRHEQECHRQPVMEGRWQLRCKPTKELSCFLAG